MSSNDFDGPSSRPAGEPGADGQGAGEQDGQGKVQYPAPEGWQTGGFWRDSAIDSNYETGNLAAVRPPSDGSGEDSG